MLLVCSDLHSTENSRPRYAKVRSFLRLRSWSSALWTPSNAGSEKCILRSLYSATYPSMSPRMLGFRSTISVSSRSVSPHRLRMLLRCLGDMVFTPFHWPATLMHGKHMRTRGHGQRRHRWSGENPGHFPLYALPIPVESYPSKPVCPSFLSILMAAGVADLRLWIDDCGLLFSRPGVTGSIDRKIERIRSDVKSVRAPASASRQSQARSCRFAFPKRRFGWYKAAVRSATFRADLLPQSKARRACRRQHGRGSGRHSGRSWRRD